MIEKNLNKCYGRQYVLYQQRSLHRLLLEIGAGECWRERFSAFRYGDDRNEFIPQFADSLVHAPYARRTVLMTMILMGFPSFIYTFYYVFLFFFKNFFFPFFRMLEPPFFFGLHDPVEMSTYRSTIFKSGSPIDSLTANAIRF